MGIGLAATFNPEQDGTANQVQTPANNMLTTRDGGFLVQLFQQTRAIGANVWRNKQSSARKQLYTI